MRSCRYIMALFYFKPYGNPTQYNFPLNIMHALSIYRCNLFEPVVITMSN